MPRNRLHHGVFLTNVLRDLIDRLLTMIGCCNPELSPKKRQKKTVRSESDESSVTESSESVSESEIAVETLFKSAEGMAVHAGTINERLLRLLELLEEQGTLPLTLNLVTRPILQTFFKRNHTNFL